MIQSFRHKDLKPFCETGSKAGIVADHAKRLRVLLARLDAASKPEDMDLPGGTFTRIERHVARLLGRQRTGNWRLIFRFEGAEAPRCGLPRLS